jgi:hypothetical protein
MLILQTAIDVPIETNVVDKIIPISDLGEFVSGIASVGLMVAAVAFFIYLIFGGIKWILGNGDKGKIEEARATITQGFLGLTVTVAAWAIFMLVDYFLGLDIVDSSSNPKQSGKQRLEDALNPGPTTNPSHIKPRNPTPIPPQRSVPRNADQLN